MRSNLFLYLAMILSLSAFQGCGGGSGGGDGDDGGGGAAPYVLVVLSPDDFVSSDLYSQVTAIDPSGSQQGGIRYRFLGDSRALVWTGTKESVQDLGPGEIKDMGGGFQVGFSGAEGLSSERAQLWNGTEASRVSLHPATGYVSSIARGGDGTVQVGRGRPTSSTSHAMMWRGTAASFVDLHPVGYSLSVGYDGVGDIQVGTGRRDSDGAERALLWRGSAASVVDLGSGLAWAAYGDLQVGLGAPSGGSTHALLWRGTEGSRVDLHPAGFQDSRAFAVAGEFQAGYGSTSAGDLHALVWQGTAASAIDLHSVTQGYMINGAPPRNSTASGVDVNGNVVGSVSDGTGVNHAVMWMRQ